MKRFSKISGMTLVKCSARDCPSEFRTCSVPQVVDLQLLEARWSIIEVEVPRTTEWELKFLCPDHRPTRGPRGAGMINGRHWRDKAIKGRAGSTSGHSRIAH